MKIHPSHCTCPKCAPKMPRDRWQDFAIFTLSMGLLAAGLVAALAAAGGAS